MDSDLEREAIEHERAALDADLEAMSRERLIAEVKRLRQGIRGHRDSSGHELCWHHPALWSLLPERTDPLPVVPDWPEFLRGCLRYRQSLDEQLPEAPRSNAPYPGDDAGASADLDPGNDVDSGGGRDPGRNPDASGNAHARDAKRLRRQ